MNHIWEEHENCRTMSCPICDGGLAVCIVCGLIEGSLTTECPGYYCWHEKQDDIYKGKTDFIDGRWTVTCPPHSPEQFNTNKRRV